MFISDKNLSIHPSYHKKKQRVLRNGAPAADDTHKHNEKGSYHQYVSTSPELIHSQRMNIGFKAPLVADP